MWNIGRAGASNAAQHAIANATIASIFRDAFSFAIRNPRGDSMATVFIACWRNAASGYTKRRLRSKSNRVWPIRTVFPSPAAFSVVMLRRLDWHELGQRESAEQWQAMGGEAIVNEPKSRHA